ncbi:MAG TPA: polyprenyl synthetase family protein [Candidatus Methylacidiphilales bacterium]
MESGLNPASIPGREAATGLAHPLLNGGLHGEKMAEKLAAKLKELDARILSEASLFDADVVAYLEYVLRCHGKRLRPTLALLCGEATGGIKEAHLDVGAIVEMIHLATLVHDDIMDGAERRRGQPTASSRWGAEISVLVGDCLFSHALHVCSTKFPQEASQVISGAVREVCTGEILQTQRRFDLSLSQDDYIRIVRMKTGELFRVACHLAAWASGADAATVAALGRYGESLGIAYQIYDDCLDFLGTEEEAGKTLGTDLEKGKITLPFLYLLQSTQGAAHEALCEVLLHGGPEERRGLVAQVKESGALAQTLDALAAHLETARAALDLLPPSEAKESLGAIPITLAGHVAALTGGQAA